jgi:hypothetical protein
MAKKMLINADMLLATPRTAEKTPPSVTEPVEEKKYIAPPIQLVAPTVAEPEPQPVKKAIKSVQKGLKTGETRATFIVQEEDLEKIKAIAYWDRRNIKDVINAAFAAFIDAYEKKSGKIQAIPKM